MAVRKILTLGDPNLRKISNKVTRFDIRLALLLRDMKDTMYQAEGVGLAAPQIGILRRVVVIDTGDGLLELINPEIISTAGEIGMVEGCLSIPGRRGFVTRPAFARVRAQDRSGASFDVEGDGLLGRALQHELDHLDGRMYVDFMDYEVFDEQEPGKDAKRA